MNSLASARVRARRPVRRGGRRKRFDTMFEKFWFDQRLKAALVRWGMQQPGALDYSSVMRLVVDRFIREEKVAIPSAEEAAAILSGQTDR